MASCPKAVVAVAAMASPKATIASKAAAIAVSATTSSPHATAMGATTTSPTAAATTHRRFFHTYFVTHLPSSSLHPDSRSVSHKLPRDASMPHTPSPGAAAAVALPNMQSRDLTVVRIPLRRAKHHFGACSARGSRAYNEDADQAGIIELPAFARRAPMSVKRPAVSVKQGEATPADGASGEPQIFYFGVFDGHGGTECSHFLRDGLHAYIERAAVAFGLKSTLRRGVEAGVAQLEERERVRAMQHDLVGEYKTTIGGYFRRFSPQYVVGGDDDAPVTVEATLAYAFLRADLDFVTAQARKTDADSADDAPLNSDEILGAPHAPRPARRFKGGSTASVALISTPTPVPFWHPAATASLVVAHVGDTRILACCVARGLPHPLTSDHHPSSPTESARLRRYAPAGSLVSGDSFGEQRITGLANSRAFGDVGSKRIGVSAEAEISRLELAPAQFSFLVLVTDGVSGSLSDQEIVDVVKEAKTPEEGAAAVVEYATDVSLDGDNASCQVVRLGGWERRLEGGLGSLGTKEIRDIRRAEALDPRRANR